MKKIFSKIFIVTLVLGFLFAPASGYLSISEKSASIESNKVSAQNIENWTFEWTSVLGVKHIEGPFSSKTLCDARRLLEINVSPTPCQEGLYATAQDVANAENNLNKNEYGCSPNPITWHKCIVGWIYALIFQPMAFFAVLAARILDFFVFYSISSGSYTSDFIEKGWGVVRDIANVLFIVALLYVAVKTVLDLNSSNNKKMVGMIIVMALLINFSLFATNIVIDASNILARVFYANIKSIDPNGNEIEKTKVGEKSVTVGLVKQFDPQRIFEGSSGVKIEDNIGTFATILFIAIIMMGYMIFMFLSVALLFVARVIMLWILIIFSPIAFVSLTIPGVNIPGFGWNEWWKQLSDNAFLAPVFVFFLYLIITFGDLVKVVTSSSDLTVTDNVNGASVTQGVTDSTFVTYMGIIIPFILIFVLLMKAKEIAIKMSGEMGAAVKTGAAMLGGVAFGGAALLGTQTLGRAAVSLGNSKFAERLRNTGTRIEKDKDGNDVVVSNKGLAAYGARLGLKTFKSAGEGSFNVKNTVLGQGISKLASGGDLRSVISGLGDTKGGYQASIDKKAKKIEEEKELYKTNMSDDETKAYTLEKRATYLKDLETKVTQAKEDAKKAGKTSDDDQKAAAAEATKQYVILKGEAPKVHEKAESLNKERMLSYKDRIGKNDLLSALSYSSLKIGGDKFGREINENTYLKAGNDRAYREALRKRKKQKAKEEAIARKEAWTKEKEDEWEKQDENKLENLDTTYDSSVAKEMNDARAKTAKMYIGAAVGIGAGMVGGAVSGFAGTATMNATAGALAAKTSNVEKAIQDKAIESMDKEAKNTEKLANRIADLNKTLKDGKSIQREQIIDPITKKPVIDTITGNPMTSGLFIQNTPGIDTEEVDKVKLRTALAKNETEIKLLEKTMEKYPSNPQLVKDMTKLRVDREIMQGLKTAEEKLFDLTGKKPGGGSSAPTPPPATP
ncbi:MAG: hypothetical protein WC011_04290 [Candidatus Paceibacterota bacterium]